LRTLAREVERYAIDVKVARPGPDEDVSPPGDRWQERESRSVWRQAIPLGRLGELGDLAAAVAFLAWDDAAFITDQKLSVSGGLTMA
jgi:NAD(P)-dependent dehydrogenase (short-subunit alcohol dehydrogenase family)